MTRDASLPVWHRQGWFLTLDGKAPPSPDTVVVTLHRPPLPAADANVVYGSPAWFRRPEYGE